MATNYVRIDEHGVMRVGETRVMLDSIVAGFKQGFSAEAIQQQYPAATLEEVYGAIAYYLGNRETVEEYLARQEEVWQKWRSESERNTGDVVRRFREQAEAAAREAS